MSRALRISFPYLLLCLLFLCSRPVHTTSNLPQIGLECSWNSQVTQYPMAYGSASLRVADSTVFVLNGAGVGNEIVKFNLTGGYLNKYPGWYNWPAEMTLGPDNQVLMSAIGAMGDDHMLGFGMVLYNKSGDFFHGFQEAETGLVRPYGLNNVQPLQTGSQTQVVVTDWGNNETRILKVDWDEGSIGVEGSPIMSVPYPFRAAVNKGRVLVASMVCCEEWHEPLKKVTLFDLMNGSYVNELKNLPTGETLTDLQQVSTDPLGNYLVVDVSLNKTVVLSEELEYIGAFPIVPKSIDFYSNKMFTLEEELDMENGEEKLVHKVKVYSYNK